MSVGSGDPGACGVGNGQGVIECVIRACQTNMTDACVRRMMQDPIYFGPWIGNYCRLSVDNLDVALSNTCRSFCQLDRNACRMRRQVFCQGLDMKTASDKMKELCACYLPRSSYDDLIERVAASSSVTREQLDRLRDILGNAATSSPYCWDSTCTSSEYGRDTEITMPCQSVGLCIQHITVPGTDKPIPNLTLENNCTLTRVLPAARPTDCPTTAIMSIDSTWVWIAIISAIVLVIVAVAAFYLLKKKPEPVIVPIPWRTSLSIGTS